MSRYLRLMAMFLVVAGIASCASTSDRSTASQDETYRPDRGDISR